MTANDIPLREVGRVAALWRYPVKSMAAERLERADVSWHGLAGDRRWGFVRPGLERSDFPWLTIRQRPELLQYRPRLVEPGRPDDSHVVVRTPAGDELDVLDAALADQLDDGARVMKQRRGIFDTFVLSLLTSQSVAGMAALAGRELDVQRFRPNLLVVAADDAPFAEDAWVGCVLRIGDARIRVDKRDQRCVVVNVDPATSERDPVILRVIARERESCLGVYGSTVRPGGLAVGDPVLLEEALRGPSRRRTSRPGSR